MNINAQMDQDEISTAPLFLTYDLLTYNLTYNNQPPPAIIHRSLVFRIFCASGESSATAPQAQRLFTRQSRFRHLVPATTAVSNRSRAGANGINRS